MKLGDERVSWTVGDGFELVAIGRSGMRGSASSVQSFG